MKDLLFKLIPFVVLAMCGYRVAYDQGRRHERDDLAPAIATLKKERDLARSDFENASATIGNLQKEVFGLSDSLINMGMEREELRRRFQADVRKLTGIENAQGVLTMEEAKAAGIPGPPGDPNYEALEAKR